MYRLWRLTRVPEGRGQRHAVYLGLWTALTAIYALQAYGERPSALARFLDDEVWLVLIGVTCVACAVGAVWPRAQNAAFAMLVLLSMARMYGFAWLATERIAVGVTGALLWLVIVGIHMLVATWVDAHIDTRLVDAVHSELSEAAAHQRRGPDRRVRDLGPPSGVERRVGERRERTWPA